jgi:hypothetical protein
MVYVDKALKSMQMSAIIRKGKGGEQALAAVDQMHIDTKLPLPILPPKWSITDGRLSGNLLWPTVLTTTVHATLNKDLKLFKKLARWVPNRWMKR